MKALTIDYAIEHKFTAIDCIKYFKPDWTNEECDFHLWNETCYPFSTDIMMSQLNEEFLTPPKG